MSRCWRGEAGEVVDSADIVEKVVRGFGEKKEVLSRVGFEGVKRTGVDADRSGVG